MTYKTETCSQACESGINAEWVTVFKAKGFSDYNRPIIISSYLTIAAPYMFGV